MSRKLATPVVRIDESWVRATEWQFAEGAETGWHIHGHDYVVVPLEDGPLHLEEPGGESRTADLNRHMPYSRRAGVEHNVVSAGAGGMRFLEVEIIRNASDEARLACLSRYANAWNAGDAAAAAACLSEHCRFRPFFGPGSLDGRDAALAGIADLLNAHPDFVLTARHWIAGDSGFSEWTAEGTGTPGALEGCSIYQFDGDLIDTIAAYQRPASR